MIVKKSGQIRRRKSKMKRFKKLVSVLTLTAMLAASLTACGGKDPVAEDDSTAGTTTADSSTATTETSGDSTFTYAISGDPTETVNVITTSDRWGLSTVKMIYSPLYMNNADGINWFLATDYSVSDDNLTYTFKLRDDVKWSDGEPFTADDVVFTYEAMEQEDNLGWAYSQLVYDQGTVKVEKVDDYTVSFTFPFVTPTAIEMLSQIFIMPEHIYKDVTDFEHNDYNMNSVGTGPYKLVDYQSGSYLKFEANENYYKGEPSIKNVVFQIIENADTAILALQNGEVDAYQMTPQQVKKLDLDASNLTAYSYTEGRVGYLQINCNRVTDENVRKALLFAMDRKAMDDAAFESDEYYSIPYTFLPTNSQFYTEDGVEKYEQDVDKAKSMLEEAGVSGLKLKLGYISSDAVQSAQALLIQEQLQEVGVTVELAGGDGTAIANAMKDPDNEYDMYLGGYIMGIDPDTFSSLFENDGAYNYMHYSGYDTIDQLFEEGRSELDESARKETYAKLQAAVQDTGAFYPIISNNKILVANNRIQGVEDAGLVPVYTFEDTSSLKIAE